MKTTPSFNTACAADTSHLTIKAASVSLVDKRRVAEVIGLSVRTVDNLLQKGMPHIRLGSRRVRFDLDDVIDWIKKEYGTRKR